MEQPIRARTFLVYFGVLLGGIILLSCCSAKVSFPEDAAVYVRTDAGKVRLPDEAARQVLQFFNDRSGSWQEGTCDCAEGISLSINGENLLFQEDHCNNTTRQLSMSYSEQKAAAVYQMLLVYEVRGAVGEEGSP